MKFTQRLSLRVRLTLIFLILASVTWLLSSFVAWKQTTDNVDELFDTQLMLFAKRLSTLDLNEINAADRMAQTPNRLKHGHVDDDALTFAIFTHDGRMVTVSVPGRVTLARSAQSENANWPIFVTPSGMTISVRPLLLNTE